MISIIVIRASCGWSELESEIIALNVNQFWLFVLAEAISQTTIATMAAHISPLDAAQEAINYCRQINLEDEGSVQRRAWDEWHDTSEDIKRKLDGESSDRIQAAAPLVSIFSRLFLCESLGDVVFDVGSISHLGVTSSEPHKATTITISRDHPRGPNDRSVSEAVIGTVLHECIHAYFVKVICYGDATSELCKALNCKPRVSGELAEEDGGHGLAWHELAAVVEETASVVLDMRIRLGRESAAEKHTRMTNEMFEPRSIYTRLFPLRRLRIRYQHGRRFIELE